MGKKIIQFIPNLLSGGAERFVVDLVNLQAKTNEVTLVLFYAEEQVPKQLFLKNIGEQVNVIFLNKKIGFDKKIFLKIKAVLNKIKPDIVHTHLGTFRYVYLTMWIFNLKIKAVHTIHSEADKEVNGQLDLKLRRFFYKKKICNPVTISENNSKSFMRFYPKIAFTQIENGRSQEAKSPNFEQVKEEINRYKFDAQTRVFLFVGRISYPKNVLLLLNAFLKLIQSHNNCILLLIGRMEDFEERIAIEKIFECSENEAQNKIIYLGEKTNVSDYLSLSNFICFSSRFEGMPISLIEAFAEGVIPIVTPVGAMPTMVGENGFIAAGLGIDEYEKQLRMACNSSEKILRIMSNTLRELYADKYDMIICADKYKKLYECI